MINMEKFDKKELVDLIVQITEEYTDGYFIANNTNKIDKQLWAALHIGIVVTLKKIGYSENDLLDAFSAAQLKIQEFRSWKSAH